MASPAAPTAAAKGWRSATKQEHSAPLPTRGAERALLEDLAGLHGALHGIAEGLVVARNTVAERTLTQQEKLAQVSRTALEPVFRQYGATPGLVSIAEELL
jgi:hypothetical protein